MGIGTVETTPEEDQAMDRILRQDLENEYKPKTKEEQLIKEYQQWAENIRNLQPNWQENLGAIEYAKMRMGLIQNELIQNRMQKAQNKRLTQMQKQFIKPTKTTEHKIAPIWEQVKGSKSAKEISPLGVYGHYQRKYTQALLNKIGEKKTKEKIFEMVNQGKIKESQIPNDPDRNKRMQKMKELIRKEKEKEIKQQIKERNKSERSEYEKRKKELRKIELSKKRKAQGNMEKEMEEQMNQTMKTIKKENYNPIKSGVKKWWGAIKSINVKPKGSTKGMQIGIATERIKKKKKNKNNINKIMKMRRK